MGRLATSRRLGVWWAAWFVLAGACGRDEAEVGLAQRPGGETPELDGRSGTVGVDATTASSDEAGGEVADGADDSVASETTAEVAEVEEVGPGPCDGPEDCPAPACWKPVCGDGVCGIEPDHGALCDDGDACTDEDRCVGGVCAGAARVCDDLDACTDDGCDPETGACVASPIVGCVADTRCVGKAAGTPCDDGVEDTSGDLCLAGRCAGFSMIRVEPERVPNAVGLVITEIDGRGGGPTEWSSAFWILEEDFGEAHVLAGIERPEAPEVHAETRQEAPFHGLMDGFASDEDGYIWQLEAGEWSFVNAWDDALDGSGRGRASGLFTVPDAGDGRRMWLVGEDGGDEWVRYCRALEDEVLCDWQELDDFDPSSVPSSVTGVSSCDDDGACEVHMVLAADAFAGFGYYNDSYENAGGAAEVWEKGAVPSNAMQRRTRAVAAWVGAEGVEALVVGTGGLMLHRRGSGEWSGSVTVREGQGGRTFSGVVASAEMVAVIGTRRSGDQLLYELWTAALAADVEAGDAWHVQTLVSAPPADAAGLYDVAVAGGEVRIVGAIRRPAPNVLGLLDGLVLRRDP